MPLTEPDSFLFVAETLRDFAWVAALLLTHGLACAAIALATARVCGRKAARPAGQGRA